MNSSYRSFILGFADRFPELRSKDFDEISALSDTSFAYGVLGDAIPGVLADLSNLRRVLDFFDLSLTDPDDEVSTVVETAFVESLVNHALNVGIDLRPFTDPVVGRGIARRLLAGHLQ